MFPPVSGIRNSRKNKNRQPIRAAVFSPPAEILFGEFPHHTSSGTFVPDQGHLSSPLPGCQTRLRVVPDVGSDHNKLAARGKKILCHRKQRDPSVSRYKPSFRHSPRARVEWSEFDGYVYFFLVDLFRAAHGAFISCESLLLPAAVIPPFLFAVEERPPPFFRAHRTLIAAAIFARA